jgi:hypothetical protein
LLEATIYCGEKFMLEALAGPEQKRQVLDRLRAEGLKIPHCGALRFLKNHKNPAREIVFWTPAGRRVAWHQPLPRGFLHRARVGPRQRDGGEFFRRLNEKPRRGVTLRRGKKRRNERNEELSFKLKSVKRRTFRSATWSLARPPRATQLLSCPARSEPARSIFPSGAIKTDSPKNFLLKSLALIHLPLSHRSDYRGTSRPWEKRTLQAQATHPRSNETKQCGALRFERNEAGDKDRCNYFFTILVIGR